GRTRLSRRRTPRDRSRRSGAGCGRSIRVAPRRDSGRAARRSPGLEPPRQNATRQHTIAAAMNDTDLCWVSAFDLAAAIAKKKVSPVEVVDATLARIDKLKELNAYVTLDADGARKAAKAAERAVGQRGVKLGPLHGVPFSVKDLIITKGIRTTFGTPLYRDNVPAEDAPSVARMKAAGAILLGKPNTPTLGWLGVTADLLFGVTRNPWRTRHTPRGSS